MIAAFLSLAALCSCAAVPAGSAHARVPRLGTTTGSETLWIVHLGARRLDDGFWDSNGTARALQLDGEILWGSADEPSAFGIEVVTPLGGPPGEDPSQGLNLEASLFYGTDSSGGQVDAESAFAEFDLGLRGTASFGPATFFVGGGAAFVWASIDLNATTLSFSGTDTDLGPYVHGGVLFGLGHGFQIGLELRAASELDLKFGGFGRANADYTQATLLIAFSI